MSDSYSYTESKAFTVTHARHMAAKVATDLKRMQRFYGKPSDESIADYETEATEMLRAGYLGPTASRRTASGSSRPCATPPATSLAPQLTTTTPARSAREPTSAAPPSTAT
jgi:hypothetical protein